MRWKCFFLLAVLIPALVYGLNQKECTHIANKILPEWNQHTELIQQFKKAPQINEGLDLLKESLGCCQRALGYCRTILKDINSQSKSDQKKRWRIDLKNRCEQDKKSLIAEINQIEFEIKKIEANIAAAPIHKMCLEKIVAAQNKEKECLRGINNVDAVVLTLNETVILYEEAISLIKQLGTLLKPYSIGEDLINLIKEISTFQKLADKYRKEACEWPDAVIAKKAACKEKIEAIRLECRLLLENGFKRSCYELQKHALTLVEELVEGSSSEEESALKDELRELKKSIVAFEEEADHNRLTNVKPLLSKEEFESREKERKELFFKSDFFFNLRPETVRKGAFPKVIPLDGQKEQKEGVFAFFADQFYRFLILSEISEPELVVEVLEKGVTVHIEKIELPFKNAEGWEQYLKDGMVFIPDTKLKSDFGLELHLNLAPDPKHKFSLIVKQKSRDLRYQFIVSLDRENQLYACQFLAPPPWQLETLRKPASAVPNEPITSAPLSKMDGKVKEETKQAVFIECMTYPVLDQFVEELKKDPLALASFVQNEIALVDPYSYQENGVIYPPSIHRNAYVTFLEKQGSAWEQCQLLIYLLRKAGYEAEYALGDHCSLPKDFVERMLLIKLPEDQKEAFLKYPWVLFSDGKEWFPIFPWMKDMQIYEGHDVYSYLPVKYASADRWILQYLKGDEDILKHIGSDGDDTAGVLFARFAEENLRKHGLSLGDVGIHRIQLKKQFSSWKDFPHPITQSQPQIYHSLSAIPGVYAGLRVDISSHQNPKKSIYCTLPLPLLSSGMSFIRFTTEGNRQTLFAEVAGSALPSLELDSSDESINVSVFMEFFLGTHSFSAKRTYSIEKGTSAALCSHFGGDNPKVTSMHYERFTEEKDDKKKLLALLAFVGASYFEKCSRSQNILAALHKINPTSTFAFGLAKLSPDLSKGPFRSEKDLVLPQVDMLFFHAKPSEISTPLLWHQEMHTARADFMALSLVDLSSNEHQILREVFKDPYAVSTVKLLQLAHLEKQMKGLDEEGFLTFTPASFEAAQKNCKFSDLKILSPWQWNTLQALMDSNSPWNNWTYAYMTPGLVSNLNEVRKEMGTLIINPHAWHALISVNNIVSNGGLGTPLPSNYLTPSSIRNWKLVPTANSYTLQFPEQSILPSSSSSPGTKEWASDVRPWYKSLWDHVSDPVDTVTGAFYIDETDLVLPGTFPLSIRRNYNSRNPLMGNLGCGWKLSLNPFLVDQNNKRYVSELDGTVIVYCFNREADRWEVFPEDNPDLSNFNRDIGNPFQSYIKDDVLFSADGSKRFYKGGILKKWIDTRGNSLSFSYQSDRLARIESSNGDFCGFNYDHEGYISEIYVKDGRRVSYNYNSKGDLIKVTLPNTAEICYEYDRNHRIIREIKPHGKVLENVYDAEGRVREQRSPMGSQQEVVATAFFEYADGKTVVTDASGGKTTYQIYDKKIYKVTDPLGFTTLQSWFIDKESWFDPENEAIVQWSQNGGAVRSLKSITDKRGLTTSYFYDSRGNREIILLQGEDLTGNGQKTIVKKIAYNDLNLSIKEEVNGQEKLTTYDHKFPYLPKRVEVYSENTLISYTDFDYNSLGQLEREDRSGSVIFWKYNDRGYPCERIQATGTEDPDVTTTYAYNQQGQCTEIVSADETQENSYDLMGNQIESKRFSPSGELLSALRIGYDLNMAPIWKQGANTENIIYFDYHTSGLVKSKRQMLAPHSIAYTLYDYNPCGYLTEETDPRGYVTYRDYDLLGRIKAETREDHTTYFTYEAGGLIETVTSPSGAQITHNYTTNGLLKKQDYPDGTKNTFVYDFLGRKVLEAKNDIVWEIEYDDARHRMTRTHLKTKDSEISEFDQRGNLIRFTDAAGYTSEKTYDGLNRIKTETTPGGKQTTWSYQNNLVICTHPNGETVTTQYAGGQVVKLEVTDSKGNLIASSSFCLDPKNGREEVIEGDKRTVIWSNIFGLPVTIEKGEIFFNYEYDACGNCIASVDGDGRRTCQEFDGLNRLSLKRLPGGGTLKFIYDLDSNITEYHLPNGDIWKASYDLMNRMTSEKLISSNSSSGCWKFSYENGSLASVINPMQRTHKYLYDSHGRLIQDIVEEGKRTYTYDPRGFLIAAEQTTDEHTLVERSYDMDGNLSLESIYLNSDPIQQTSQKWTETSRSLEIGDHVRDFTYQNNQLVKVSTRHLVNTYSYELNGALKSKNNRIGSFTFDYNVSGLPKTVTTYLPEGSYQELLDWHASGKLHAYKAPGREHKFFYNERGYLKSTESEKYDFDFGSPGNGVLTSISANKTNKFERIKYNEMGEVISHEQKQLFWDPWGRLTKVIDPYFSWEASYDVFGRRLQTRFTKEGEQTRVINSIYDPNEEFQEIGVQIGKKTFWKFYGPDACDSISDETGTSLTLMHNALRQLIGIVSSSGTHYCEKMPTFYGFFERNSAVPLELSSFAESLRWHSKAQDPTGFIWMGDRYYDPKNGRFLSQDSVSYPFCLDLYTYTNGDPINHFDPDGRFASPVYQPIKQTVLDIWDSPRFHGSLQAVGGFAEAGFGAGMAYSSGGLAAPVGWGVMAHGLDHCVTGIRTVVTGKYSESATSQLLQMTGVSSQAANFVDSGISLCGSMGGAGVMQRTRIEFGEITKLPLITSNEFFVNSNVSESFTKSNLQLGKQMHRSYKLGIPGFKEYRLPSGRRIDFFDPINGIIYELKPNNPRAIKLGQRQLELYLNEIRTIPRYKNVELKTVLETY